MELSGETVKVLQNGSCSVEIDLFGGAITKFCVHGEEINPLSFRLPADQMPENNKAGAPYQGHFLCLGRWGRPSEGEINARMPDHRQLSNILWEADRFPDTKILLLSILLSGTATAAAADRLNKASEQASKIADSHRIFYLNISKMFLKTDGTVSKELITADRVHLTRDTRL